MNEHDGAVARQNKVWSARQPTIIQPKPEATPMQTAADKPLRLRIASPDVTHHSGTGSRVYDVGHLVL
jgi:hypothetical protein